MVTFRDVVVALVTLTAGYGVSALAQDRLPNLHSSAFDWSSVSARDTAYGSVRQFLRAPTATLDELELHVTTLNPGRTSHEPHRHPNEELLIIREGTVEALVHGEWKRLGSGSVIFQASNELHGIRNVGDGPATYHVINWKSAATAK
jgi:XRE family transcriptional regulator, regulator of sulfur utilization